MHALYHCRVLTSFPHKNRTSAQEVKTWALLERLFPGMREEVSGAVKVPREPFAAAFIIANIRPLKERSSRRGKPNPSGRPSCRLRDAPAAPGPAAPRSPRVWRHPRADEAACPAPREVPARSPRLAHTDPSFPPSQRGSPRPCAGRGGRTAARPC